MTRQIDVLVADDDAQMRRLLQLALSRSGCVVRTVANGVELIDAVLQQTPDVVITDMRMPGMTGLAALNRLRASHPDLPCVLITAFGDHDVHRRAHSLGARSMDKPLDPDQLAQVVGELIGREACLNNRVLVVDDDVAMTDMVTRALGGRFDVHTENTLEDAWAHLVHHPADVVLTDLMLDNGTGVDLARRLREDGRRTPVIVMTAFGNLDNAVEAMRGGAYDFLTKPLDIERLELAVERAAKHHALIGEVEMLRRAVEGRRRARWMVGESEVMRDLADMVERVANTDVTVLVTGESGTGKELVARALHDLSERRQGPFIPINCAAMPATLLESELGSGHARGAFTGARESREGLFVAANGGTLFLDEIGEMAPEVQAKLLRALQEREVRPVGGNTSVPFDARIVTATHQQIEQRVREGKFREDLFYRINVVNLAVPPLRDRGNDILLLAQHFVEETAQRLRREVWGFSKAVAGRLLSHDWPGNVRELQNTVERAVALARFERLGVSDLPPKLQRARTTASAFQIEDPDFMPALADLEKRYILHVLDRCDSNRTRASEVLGIDRKTLYRKLERWSEEEDQDEA